MKRTTVMLFIALLLALAAGLVSQAAVPIRWKVETSRVQPVQIDAVHGEEIALAADMQSYGKPFDMAGKICALYWQTNGMDAAWWTAPAIVASNRIEAIFSPEMDPGAATVTGFLGAPGEIYRAAFLIRFRRGPGARPNALPLPTPTIDCRQVVWLNPDAAPFASRADVDAAVAGATPGDYDNVSNLAYSAIQKHQPLDFTNDFRRADAKINWGDVTNRDDVVTKAGATFDGNVTIGSESGSQIRSLTLPGDNRLKVGEASFSKENNEMRWSSSVPINFYGGLRVSPGSLYASNITLPYHTIEMNLTDILDSLARKSDVESVNSAASDAMSAAVSAGAAASNAVATVTTWEGFIGGSNVVISITNYISGAYVLDEAKLRVLELRDGEYKEVYNSRDEILLHLNNFKANEFTGAMNALEDNVNDAISGKADKAWGKYTSLGTPLEEMGVSNTVYMTSPNTVFGGGLEFERVAVGEGAVCILKSAGAPVYTAGEEGFFKFQDLGGTNFFGFSKTDSYMLGVNTDDIKYETVGGSGLVKLTYNIIMTGVPVICWAQDLHWLVSTPENGSYDGGVELNLPDGTPIANEYGVSVSWEVNPPEGKKVCYINVGPKPAGFYTAKVVQHGTSKFLTSMPADFIGGILATNEDTGASIPVYPKVRNGNVVWEVTK